MNDSMYRLVTVTQRVPDCLRSSEYNRYNAEWNSNGFTGMLGELLNESSVVVVLVITITDTKERLKHLCRAPLPNWNIEIVVL